MSDSNKAKEKKKTILSQNSVFMRDSNNQTRLLGVSTVYGY